MDIVKKIFERMKIIIKQKVFQIYFGFMDMMPGDKVIVNYWIAPRADPHFYNLGDDLNLVLVKLITGKRVIPYQYSTVSRHKKINYLCIGSIISQLSNECSIIWGSGVLSPDLPLLRKPLKVLAVRGPLTREYLLKNGVNCPEIYGDPVLLLPNYYQPRVLEKKYKIGIIPHYRDKEHKLLDTYEKEEGVFLFDIQNYVDYRLFIDNICSCDLIISSSLHGLILADAYGIPNVWVEFSDGKVEQFKFEDYFLSVGRGMEDFPLRMDSYISIYELLTFRDKWYPPVLDVDKLMSVCPFNQNIS